jgi:hypothetical protein
MIIHNKGFRGLYAHRSRSVVRIVISPCGGLQWAGHMGVPRKTYRISVGTRLVKRLFGRRRSRWENNINMNLRKIPQVVRLAGGCNWRVNDGFWYYPC